MSQLSGLAPRTVRGGRDSINHGPATQAHDDIPNAAAGVVRVLGSTPARIEVPGGEGYPPRVDPKPPTVDEMNRHCFGTRIATDGSIEVS